MRILKLYKEDCAPCEALTRRLNEENIEHDSLEVTASVAADFGIRSVPALIFINDRGKIVDRLLGLVSIDQIRRKLNDS